MSLNLLIAGQLSMKEGGFNSPVDEFTLEPVHYSIYPKSSRIVIFRDPLAIPLQA